MHEDDRQDPQQRTAAIARVGICHLNQCLHWRNAEPVAPRGTSIAIHRAAPTLGSLLVSTGSAAALAATAPWLANFAAPLGNGTATGVQIVLAIAALALAAIGCWGSSGASNPPHSLTHVPVAEAAGDASPTHYTPLQLLTAPEKPSKPYLATAEGNG